MKRLDVSIPSVALIRDSLKGCSACTEMSTVIICQPLQTLWLNSNKTERRIRGRLCPRRLPSLHSVFSPCVSLARHTSLWASFSVTRSLRPLLKRLCSAAPLACSLRMLGTGSASILDSLELTWLMSQSNEWLLTISQASIPSSQPRTSPLQHHICI